MGTTAAFYASDPSRGGVLLGTLRMDGHPDRMARLARAKTRSAFRSGVRAIRAREGRTWWDPARVWWTWPSNGRICHDYSYWWDEARGAAMCASFQYGPVVFDAEVAADSKLWPGSASTPNPDLIGVPLPEFFATVDPWTPSLPPLHTRSSAEARRGEAAADRLLSGCGVADLTLERDARGIAEGRRGSVEAFSLSGPGGVRIAGSATVAQAAGSMDHISMLTLRKLGALGPAGPESAPFLYSVEDFLQECRIGHVRIARRDRGRLFLVEASHPLHGFLSSEADSLAKALILARRKLLAAPGFHLTGVPPYGVAHRGNDPEEAAEADEKGLR